MFAFPARAWIAAGTGAPVLHQRRVVFYDQAFCMFESTNCCLNCNYPRFNILKRAQYIKHLIRFTTIPEPFLKMHFYA